MNKADGKKLGARAANKERRAIVREVEQTQALSFLATCDLLAHLFDMEPTSLDAWHKLGKLTERQIEGIEHYLATRERNAEDPEWIERLKETVQRYRRERAQADSRGMRRFRQQVAQADMSAFDLE
jgi:hypothetical protein